MKLHSTYFKITIYDVSVYFEIAITCYYHVTYQRQLRRFIDIHRF